MCSAKRRPDQAGATREWPTLGRINSIIFSIVSSYSDSTREWLKLDLVVVSVVSSGSETLERTLQALRQQRAAITQRLPTHTGTTRAEDAQGTPTQSDISPSILVYEVNHTVR